MSERVARYLELEARLLAWRDQHPEDTPEEDAILDEMDQAWWEMTDDERKSIESRGANPPSPAGG